MCWSVVWPWSNPPNSITRDRLVFPFNDCIHGQFSVRNTHYIIHMSLQCRIRNTQFLFCSLFILKHIKPPGHLQITEMELSQDGEKIPTWVNSLTYAEGRSGRNGSMHLPASDCLCEWSLSKRIHRTGPGISAAAEQRVPWGELSPFGLPRRTWLRDKEYLRCAH